MDTSAHYAIADAGDRDHSAAVDFLNTAADERRAFVTSNFIVAETYGLILIRLGRGKAIDYVGFLRSGSTAIKRITPEDEERAWEILAQYDDQDFSYVDATSFALMERLGILEVFAFDKHFDIFKTKQGHRLTRLPYKVRLRRGASVNRKRSGGRT
jgi:predicted nucleic acid-binding protein